MGQKHIHAELIKAWADGGEIQQFDYVQSLWVSVDNPIWHEMGAYRINPQPKLDIGIVARVDLFKGSVVYLRRDDYYPANVRLIFDADTQNLKAVELIK